MGVALAVDGTLYQSDVYAASHGTTNLVRSPRRHGKSFWGHKPVLLLLGIRLGLDGVNPIYYSTIKVSSIIFSAYMRYICVGFDADGLIIDALYVPAICWNRGWSSKFILLLRWVSSGQPLLSRPASRKAHRTLKTSTASQPFRRGWVQRTRHPTSRIYGPHRPTSPTTERWCRQPGLLTRTLTVPITIQPQPKWTLHLQRRTRWSRPNPKSIQHDEI